MVGLLLHLGVLGLAIWLFCALCYMLFWVCLSLGIIIPMIIIPESLPDWFMIAVPVGYATLLISLARKEIIQFLKHPIKFVHDFFKDLKHFFEYVRKNNNY